LSFNWFQTYKTNVFLHGYLLNMSATYVPTYQIRQCEKTRKSKTSWNVLISCLFIMLNKISVYFFRDFYKDNQHKLRL